MNCAPIIARELRVAARKRSTFWLRVVAAAAGLLIGSGCLILSGVQGVGTAQVGRVLFGILTWLGFVAGISAGLFFTSDCLSEEKREGTLGLLFLTELRGYDVVLGKLLATSLRGFFALLAVLPILAVTLLMGGVTGAQFWKSALALVNALFVSLAAGMFVSALSRDSQKALGATLLMLLLLSLGGLIADTIIAGMKKRGFQPVCSLLSPGYGLWAAGAWGRAAYWSALAATQVAGWLMFALACVLVPHSWQERKGVGASTSRGWAYRWKYGGKRRRLRLRSKLLGRHPMAWLACRERWQAWGLWIMAVLTVSGLAAALLGHTPREAWMVWTWVGGLFTLILYLLAASQGSRLLLDARRSGLLELILVAPVSERQIVAGQWRGWLRIFGLPMLLLLAVHVTGATMAQLSFQNIAAQVGTATSTAVTNQSGTISNQTKVGASVTVSVTGTTNVVAATGAFQPGSRRQQFAMAAGAALAAALNTAANLLALCWFGMWMGMTSKTANMATLKTIFFVQVIPWLVITFTTSTVVGLIMAGFFFRGNSVQPGAWLLWWPLLSAAFSAALALAKDAGFIAWSRKKLRSSLRQQAAQSHGQSPFITSKPLRQVAAVGPSGSYLPH